MGNELYYRVVGGWNRVRGVILRMAVFLGGRAKENGFDEDQCYGGRRVQAGP